MELENTWPSILRPVIYVGAGFLPAFAFAVLSLALLRDLQFVFVFVTVLAWMGLFGLVMAVLHQPSKTDHRLRLVVTILLMLGLLAITPLLAAAIFIFAPYLWVSAVVLGPCLVALHYTWGVTLISSTTDRLILAFSGALIFAPPALFYALRPW